MDEGLNNTYNLVPFHKAILATQYRGAAVSVNGKASSHAISEAVARLNYREHHHEVDKQATALKLEAEKDILTHMEDLTTKTKSFSLNLSGKVGADSKITTEEKIRNAWSSAYGIPADKLSVVINKLDDSVSGVTRVAYTVTVHGESYHSALKEANQRTLESYLKSSGLSLAEGEATTYRVETTLEASSHTSSSATPTVTTTLLPDSAHTESRYLEDTIYFKGGISDNYQPLVQSMLQSAMNKTANDSGTVTTYVVKILDKSLYTDKSGNSIAGYRYSVKNSSGGPPPSLSEEQSRTFTNQVTIELHNTNVFKQDEVVLYSGSVQGLNSVGSTVNDEVIVTTLEPGRKTAVASFEIGSVHSLNSAGSTVNDEAIVTTLEPGGKTAVTSFEIGSMHGLNSTRSSVNDEAIVTTLEPGGKTAVSSFETTWNSFEPGTSHQSNSNVSRSEHFVTDFGRTETVNINAGSSTQHQEVTYHSEQFATQVFHIQKDVFSESQEMRVVHGGDDGKNHF